MLSGTGEPVPFQEERLFGELNRGCIFENVPQELKPSSVACFLARVNPLPFQEERLFGELNRGCIFENVPQELKPSSVACFLARVNPCPSGKSGSLGNCG